MHLDYTRGCVLKRNGKWGLYDAYEAKKLIAGKADTVEGLIKLWLNG